MADPVITVGIIVVHLVILLVLIVRDPANLRGQR